MKTLLCAVALVALAGCSRPKPPVVYGEVPPFKLISETAGEFDSRALAGKVWVADFMFTRCLGPCPRMSSRMHWLQKQTADVADLRLVSFTIDPEHDTPAVLAEYAKRFRAAPDRWHFLTGPTATIQNLNRNAFKLGDIDGSMMHSTRFVLVDRRGRIRGYYRTEEGESLDPLVADIRRVAKEAS
ncbi:MAG TPA: SCO family protein [Bryobacteraceae bacterium]|nr:SCO family protein [Bryobacteraceae bacterium]